jgi:hypothetical protein
MGVGVGGMEGRGPAPFGGGGYVPGGGMYCGGGICGIGDAAYIGCAFGGMAGG